MSPAPRRASRLPPLSRLAEHGDAGAVPARSSATGNLRPYQHPGFYPAGRPAPAFGPRAAIRRDDGRRMCVDVSSSVRKDVRMAVRTNLMLPPELVAEVDRIAGPRNRSRYVAAAVQARLRRDRLKEVWDRSFGILRTEDYPYWATSDMVVEWVRARRAEETDPGPDPIPVGTVPEGYPRPPMVQRREAEVASTGGTWANRLPPEADDADPG